MEWCLFQATLYPTVGLQTPEEVVEANFGQSQFVFDFDDYLKVGSSFYFGFQNLKKSTINQEFINKIIEMLLYDFTVTIEKKLSIDEF